MQSFEGISPQHVALSMYPMGPALQEIYPEIVDFVRFVNGGTVLRNDSKQIIVEKTFWTDPAFFSIFDFALRRGDRATALNEPNSAVLTQETAQKLFGTDDVIGKSFLQGERQLKVTGVLENLPKTSHLQFDALFSVITIEDERARTNWGSNWLVTYLLLAPGADVEKLEAAFPQFLEKNMGEGKKFYELYLQPLHEVHLGSMNVTHDYHNWQKFDGKYIFVFSLLAVFVLLIAAINFMNLSTARSSSRSKEVGVRKSVGAHRLQLARQFLGESVILAFIALAVAVLLAEVALPLLNTISRRSLELNLFSDPALLPGMIGFTFLLGLVAGIYPALFLSSFQAVEVLKDKTPASGRKVMLRNVLVVAQFAIAIALIVGTALTVQQFRFMKDRNPGFQRDQIVLLKMNGTSNNKYDLLKEEFLRNPAVLAVTASGQRLGNNIHQNSARTRGDSAEIRLSPSHLHVTRNFIEFYGLKIVAGRAFSDEIPTDKRFAYIVNEALVKDLGWDDPIGKQFGVSWEDTLGTVIGVVKDFNFNSLHHKIQPLYISSQDWGYDEMSVKISPQNYATALGHLEKVWNEHVPDRPFQYIFLDEHFETLYLADRQVSQIVGVIAGLAIFTACLGLFGLAAITTEQRTKEIGIRKVLGASLLNLITLLAKNFVRLVLLAFLIAAPVAYFIMQNWLQNFVYRIAIDWWVFLFAGGIALVIALATVSTHALKAALANPVETLRYE
ncbi:ABC transporter permease [candidate division KSB1 bacterium]|nr:ABC transporter permease [candidate division KSB1 bacterium]